MNRIVVVLLLAVMASGYPLIQSAYESRRLFTELDRAQTEGRRLDVDWERLQAARHLQATNLRVEQVARERLHMRVITPAVTHDVQYQGIAQPTAASGVSP